MVGAGGGSDHGGHGDYDAAAAAEDDDDDDDDDGVIVDLDIRSRLIKELLQYLLLLAYVHCVRLCMCMSMCLCVCSVIHVAVYHAPHASVSLNRPVQYSSQSPPRTDLYRFLFTKSTSYT